jgi:cytochrome c oxidase assembly protein subunit 19
MSYGGPNTASIFIKPPLKGSFPLDHDGTCADLVQEYLLCMKKFATISQEHSKLTSQDICRGLVVKYFDCRMKHGLMEREEWEALGLEEHHISNKRGQPDRENVKS